MAIIEQYIDAADKIRITWEHEGELFLFKFDSEPTELELQKFIDAAILNLELSAVQPIADYLEIMQLLVPLIENIKSNVLVTFNDYQQYNSNLDWATSLKLQSFLLDFSIKTNCLQSQSLEECFQNFYSFAMNNSNEKIARSLFNGNSF
jgi:hypothetical protein